MIENTPELWLERLPRPDRTSHKYSRGHAVVLGGTRMTGAARLASEAAMRIGAGLCTIVCDEAVRPVYQHGAAHILVESYSSLGRFANHLIDTRRNATLLGPGAGLEDKAELKQAVLDTLTRKRACVLDADALSVFADTPARLLTELHLHGHCVLTPHEGEFAHLFPELKGERIDRAATAARHSKAVVLLKGAHTVIAGPEGQIVINTHATPYLATAGSGDVLSGIILGLLAQGMSAFDAACAGAWIHGDVGLHIEAGLVAPDLIAVLPATLKALLAHD